MRPSRSARGGQPAVDTPSATTWGARLPGADAAAPPEADVLSTRMTIVLLAAHVPLALAFRTAGPTLATLHALLIFALGVSSAMKRRADRVVLIVGYIAGAEVLWRMTNARIYWEFGKYGAAALMLLTLLRGNLGRPPMLPLTYFALLLPSCFITLSSDPWPVATNQLSFNLSGPFALMVAAWFFSTVRLTRQDLRSFFLAATAPILGVLTLAVYGMVTATGNRFIDQSNLAASGGFGPNQVSAVLGMGALLALFVVTDGRARRSLRFILIGLIIAFAVQSALTFSRGGLAAAVGAAAIAACFSAKDTNARGKLLPIAVAIVAVGYLALPYLDAYTGGEMSIRFQDASLTGRGYMARQEFDLFTENPILGVGPGGARVQRMGVFFVQGGPRIATSRAGLEYAAHTEYARLLSEHGSFGLLALVILVCSALQNVQRVQDPVTRGLVAGLVCWSGLFMVSSAMRIFFPSLAFGLAFATLVTSASDKEPGRAVANGLRRLTAGHPSLQDRRSTQLSL